MQINYGNSTNFSVWYDDSLTGATGLANGPALSQKVLDYCENDLQRLSLLFNNIKPLAANLPIQIQIVPGAGGASNNGSNQITCYVNATSGTYNQFGLSPLIVAEEAEIFMVLQNAGWISNWSNGEALSRVIAQVLYPTNAWLFASGAGWYNPGNIGALPDWVDNVDPIDTNSISYGCGALFLNYLAYQLNFKWTDIIAAIAPAPNNSLASMASQLGVANSYNNFVSLLQAYFPIGNLYIATTPSTDRIDNVFPLGAITSHPSLFMRHNLADDGTSHVPPLSNSPDIILKNTSVVNAQAIFSAPPSITSDTQSDADVLTGQDNFIYLRVWNRGNDAANAFATIYWSPPATLVTPTMWNLIGTYCFPDVPSGSVVEINPAGIVWPSDQIPTSGHYCFVATVGNSDSPAPSPSSFASFTDFFNYILTNNNITWRNFNVVTLPTPLSKRYKFGEYVGLPFFMTGAWDRQHIFALETLADLPKGSRMALQVPERIGRELKPQHSNMEKFGDASTDIHEKYRLRIPLHIDRPHSLGEIELHQGAMFPSHLLVHIPEHAHDKQYEIAIRQLYKEKEIGRVTWILVPAKKN